MHIEKGEKKEVAIMQTLQKYIIESKNVLFEGDGYSEEWHKEAARRGLPNTYNSFGFRCNDYR
jgi:glutamine synthetase